MAMEAVEGCGGPRSVYDTSMLADLASRLTPATLTDDPDLLGPRLTDWRGEVTGRALALARPANTAEVATIVRWANETGTPLVPQGGNTGLVGGATPDLSGTALLVSLERMRAVRSVEPDDLAITVEAGVTLQAARDAASAAGCRLPLWLGAGGTATIGGLIATNAGGVEVVRHGPMRALVLGLEAVLPDGQVLAGLGSLRKDNTGYDIKQLLIGAEGTLGFVTAATLKLAPVPAATATAWVALADPEAALALLRRARGVVGDAIESFELMPSVAVELVAEQVPGVRVPIAGAGWHVLIELAGGDWVTDALAQALGDADAVLAQSGAQAAAMWHVREAIPLAEKSAGKTLKHDITVPVSRVPEFVRETTPAVEAAFPGARVFAFGHLADGNLHYNVVPPAGDAAFMAREGGAVKRLVNDRVMAFGGSISAEHGIGTAKRSELARLGDPAKLAAMRAVKAALDPRGVMNPGKVI